MSAANNTALLATARCLALDRIGARVLGELRGRGIDALLLKGPVFAAWLWPGELRAYGDIDVLVSPAAQGDAALALRQLGFEEAPTRPGLPLERRKSQPWVHSSGAVIDLHRGLVGITASDEPAWDLLWGDRRPFELAGLGVSILSEPARAMHVALHTNQHTRQDKPLHDLARAIDVVPDATWRQASRLACRLDATTAFAGGLAVLDAGQALAERLGIHGTLPVDSVLRRHHAPGVAHGIQRLAETEGTERKAAFIVRRLLPTPTFLRGWSPLARRGKIGLLLAYPWRLLYLLGSAVPALVSWLDAKRSVRRS